MKTRSHPLFISKNFCSNEAELPQDKCVIEGHFTVLRVSPRASAMAALQLQLENIKNNQWTGEQLRSSSEAVDVNSTN